MSAPLFVSDQKSRNLLRCTECGAIWSKRKIEWRASSYGVFAIAVAAFYGAEGFYDKHGFAIPRLALAALWIWISVQRFSQSSKPSRIWVQGIAPGAAAD
jgi:hypothetical protein